MTDLHDFPRDPFAGESDEPTTIPTPDDPYAGMSDEDRAIAKEEHDLAEERALAEMALQGVGANPGSGPLIPDEELPSKVVFVGVNFDDVDGNDLVIDDRITCTVKGVVVGGHDDKRRDRVVHTVKVQVESIDIEEVRKAPVKFPRQDNA